MSGVSLKVYLSQAPYIFYLIRSSKNNPLIDPISHIRKLRCGAVKWVAWLKGKRSSQVSDLFSFADARS